MNKRIYKNREKKMLCGVCAGLAEYFDIDPPSSGSCGQ